jgi:hypothetical protein
MHDLTANTRHAAFGYVATFVREAKGECHALFADPGHGNGNLHVLLKRRWRDIIAFRANPGKTYQFPIDGRLYAKT